MRFISNYVLVFSLSIFCFAAHAETTSPKKTAPAAPAFSETNSSSDSTFESGRFVFGMGGIEASGWGVGGPVEALFRVKPVPVYVGLTSGFYYDSASSGGDSANVFIIPIMATGIYHFELPNLGIHPYAGLSLGTAIEFASANISGTKFSGSKAFFQGLLRPGLEINVSHGLNLDIEPAFGLLGDDFTFQPHASLAISF